MIETLILCIGFFVGYYTAAYKWSSNAHDYRRIEFLGTLYKVLRDDDPIFNPSDDDIARMQIHAIIRQHENETEAWKKARTHNAELSRRPLNFKQCRER